MCNSNNNCVWWYLTSLMVYDPPCCFVRTICSPWCRVSYRESSWSEVANPSTRSGKRNMSHCVIMASSLTTPVYMWVSNPLTLPHFFSNRPYVFAALVFLLEGAAFFFNHWAQFSGCIHIRHHRRTIYAHDFNRDVSLYIQAVLSNPVT